MRVFLFCLLLLFSSCKHNPTPQFSSPLPYDARWEMQASTSIRPLLAQKFYYLGSGAQMVAFLGEDQKTILKLFKMKHLLPKQWLSYLPLPPFLHEYRERKTVGRERKLNETFQSVKLAFEALPEETGVLIAKLNPSSDWDERVVIVDKQKREHLLHLGSIPFVLQQRAELIYDRLRRQLRDGDEEALERSIEQVIALIQKREAKGIVDRDSGVSANYGFVGDRAIQIDIGAFVTGSDEIPFDAEHVRKKISCWLTQH